MDGTTKDQETAPGDSAALATIGRASPVAVVEGTVVHPNATIAKGRMVVNARSAYRHRTGVGKPARIVVMEVPIVETVTSVDTITEEGGVQKTLT